MYLLCLRFSPQPFVCCLTWINESAISRWLMSYDFVKLLVFSVCRWPCCNTRQTILSTKKSKLPKKVFLCDNNMISYDQFSIFTATGACSWHVHSIRLFWRHLTPSRETTADDAWYLKFLLMLLTYWAVDEINFKRLTGIFLLTLELQVSFVVIFPQFIST